MPACSRLFCGGWPPGLFTPDLRFILYIGQADSLSEVMADKANYQEANPAVRGFWRTGLKLRVSGRKAGRLAQELIAEEQHGLAAP